MFNATSPSGLASQAQLLSLSGLEFMRGVRAGTISGAPIASLLNYSLDEVEDGRVSFVGTPLFEHANPAGGLHGGWYGTLLDSCMACAIMTKLPQESVYTTLEYKVNLTLGIAFGTAIRATGWVDHVGRSTGVSHGEIRGVDDGRLYATGSTTCLILTVTT